ncbi:transcription elongation factor GreA [Candidatus Saccharibacteria bacterium]|nr:MAG: transcription elongation factor GreA [Candidatus Saccharibacteria bacterium]
MKKLFHLTQSGVDELKVELEALKAKRIVTAEAIKTARELGDLSENAEYQSARAEQERTDGRIAEVEHILANVAVITGTTKGKKQVVLGSTVTLKHQKGKELMFQVVGTIEADPLAKKISDESPIGKALLGKKEGEDVEIVTPAETATYKIHAIG